MCAYAVVGLSAAIRLNHCSYVQPALSGSPGKSSQYPSSFPYRSAAVGAVFTTAPSGPSSTTSGSPRTVSTGTGRYGSPVPAHGSCCLSPTTGAYFSASSSSASLAATAPGTTTTATRQATATRARALIGAGYSLPSAAWMDAFRALTESNATRGCQSRRVAGRTCSQRRRTNGGPILMCNIQSDVI